MQTPTKYNTTNRSTSFTRKGDIFVEAGRLAAEYLVSQGLLPPGALSGNRTSALARLGTTHHRRGTRRIEPHSIRRIPAGDRPESVGAAEDPPPTTRSVIDSEATVAVVEELAKMPTLEIKEESELNRRPPELNLMPLESSSNEVEVSNTTTIPIAIEVIDLEADSPQPEPEPEPKPEPEPVAETPIISESETPATTTTTTTGDDGYGLMISELLHSDDININHDDDSIYMSLGEIPLTYLRPWEQPPPSDYEKPFGDA